MIPLPGELSDDEEWDRTGRRVLWALPTPLVVVGSREGDRVNLMTANWVMQVATAPRLVVLSVETTSLTCQLIRGSGRFSVSLLARDDRALVRKFVKPATEVTRQSTGALQSIQGVEVHETQTGLPVLDAAVAWMACRVLDADALEVAFAALAASGQGASEATSHALVVGQVVEVEDRRLGQDVDVLSMGDTRMNYGG